ncbi:MAG: non-canonical purine NTP pyrophosphatase, RdgB/HAM1 family [Candidatus Chisholmbacteria bacterium RIFCSPHIGHO2_12_FULL_49_9]|uniref:dITP/XTP pyrophosphatase n=1 Tax=Candidatus Chisholmbacteria bacterium RIFCSPHIGHO2_01_FULL_52_32 TaxID=1797591 RepID=A0A1G1VTR0_9BACT|nr:MAG: non-canonical purine NTP pyrophosphatase, RdgB/HAM1 family [Candidatus Chisholmbacteria bacterium RIFCSPHIGHO2_01_FULL_52_32]OGY19845.1 MAG: non-canonical purine NTP pyrophosphatase, RdgB/HAM1 family [Candidatus Chisholmbacteria bacterium RIFCSPLOWO2_01_FULL_50_28]OGY21041.1 MAG: non-canonical purine NTP pyrophosphatase, RdgB/HAM1 family [Candidatus Chisholmbacteria bacterium RIFCSPHIGHO2_12_FULL_49_9]
MSPRPMRKLLLSTRNFGKIREIKSILSGLHFELTTIDEVSGIRPSGVIEETGTTFAENAAIKAETLAKQTDLLTLADDSGLEVDALGGKPGIQSARFVEGPDELRYTRVLELLQGVPPAKRTARFKTAVAVHDPRTGRTYIFEGETEGWITTKPQGTSGFGYDPIFYSSELNKTFGEAELEEKNRVSHRGKALRKVKAFLRKLVREESTATGAGFHEREDNGDLRTNPIASRLAKRQPSRARREKKTTKK